MQFLLAVLMLAALALAGFCAGAETGFLSLNRGRITHLSREGSKAAQLIARALADMPRTLTSLLVGNNLAAVAYSSASAALAARLFDSSRIGQGVWSCAAALVMLYAGEFLPKLFCAMRPLSRMLTLAKIWRLFSYVIAPLGGAATAAVTFFLKRPAAKERVTTSELLRILEDRKDGVRLTDFESALISRILVLRKKGRPVTAEEILKALDEE